MLNDESIEPSERPQIVKFLPLNSEENYPKYNINRKRKQIRRKGKKPLAIILAASDLKHSKYSRRLLDDKDKNVLPKHDLITDKTDNSKELPKSSKENGSVASSKETASKEVLKHETSKEHTGEILPNELLKHLSREVHEHLSKESHEHLSNLSKDETQRVADHDNSTKDILTSTSKEHHHEIKEEVSNNNDVANHASDESLPIDHVHEKPIHSEIKLEKHSKESSQEHHHLDRTDSLATSVSLENSLENKLPSHLNHNGNLIIDEHDLGKKHDLDKSKVSVEVKTRSGKESADSDDDVVLVSSDGIVGPDALLKNSEKKNPGASHKSYNLSFVFNKK